MRAFALAMAFAALPALADPPKDAPVRRIIRAGDVAPADGCYLDNAACTATGKELAALRAENKSLKQSLEAQPGTVFVVGALVLGLVGGAAAATLALKR